MTKRSFIVGLVALTIALISCDRQKSAPKTPSTPQKLSRLTIGYQTAWATSGQVMETLVHTTIPKLHGSSATFRTFLFGPDMNEAAVTGSIDGTTTGVVPTVNLLAVSDEWVVVCRHVDFTVTTIARTDSGITNFAGLKGRKVAVPFGSGAHPYIVQRLKENNLSIGTGPNAVELINVSPAEAIPTLQQGAVDAAATWEPTATIMENKNIGRSIEDKRYVGLLTIRKEILEKYPDEVVALIKSLLEANLYVAKNREQTDDWFANRSKFDRELLKKIRVIEPNLKAQRIEDISLQLTADDIRLCQQVADQMFATGLIKKAVNLSEKIDTTFARKAEAEMKISGAKATSVTILEFK